MTGDGPRCPKCHEDRLVEFDVVRGLFFCSVCSASWRGRGKPTQGRWWSSFSEGAG